MSTNINTAPRAWVNRLLAIMLVACLVLGSVPASAAGAGGSTQKLPPIDQALQRIKTQVVVRFKSGVSAATANSMVSATGGVVKKSVRDFNTKLAVYGSASSAATAIKKLNKDERVVYAYYNQKISLPKDQSSISLGDHALRRAPVLPGSKTRQAAQPQVAVAAGVPQPSAISGDSLRSYQWYLDRIGDRLTAAPPASAPVVAVIDSGIDYTSPDLSGKMVGCPVLSGLPCDLVEYDQDPMDTNGHGTHVTGTIAARADASGITGVSPNSRVLSVRIFGEEGFTDLVTIFQAIQYTRQAKSVFPTLRAANMSFGGLTIAGSAEQADYNSRLAALKAAGVLPVAAAGNDSDFYLHAYPLLLGVEVAYMPAQSPSVLAVAATDQNDYRTLFSNYSSAIRINSCGVRDPESGLCDRTGNTFTTKVLGFAPVAAPGWQILANTPEGQYQQLAGTSMASPLVAGAAARIMSHLPTLTNDQVRDRIRLTGMPLGSAKGFPIATNRLDLRRALGPVATGFTGRVVNGVNGKPLAGARVEMRTTGGVLVSASVTNAAGFYTVAGATNGTVYRLIASRPGYVATSLVKVALSNQLGEPGDLSVVPVRTDGGYTIALDFNNVATGYYELLNTLLYPGYPWPVSPASMPMSLADSFFGVTYPLETIDSMEFSYAWINGPGSLASYPFGRIMTNPAATLSPHQGTILRTLVPGHTRFGVKWLSPGGPARPNAVVRVYKNATLLRTSRLASACAPSDGTAGHGTTSFSVWALHNIASTGALSSACSVNGQRTDYPTWIHRNNDIQGVPGPAAGTSVTRRLDFSDRFDVHSFDLVAGSTYTFNLAGPAGADYDLYLYSPSSRSIFGGQTVATDATIGPNATITFTVPSGGSGKYYLLAAQFEGQGNYTLSRP